MLSAKWILAKNPILHHIFPQEKVKYPNPDQILAIFSQKRNTGVEYTWVSLSINSKEKKNYLYYVRSFYHMANDWNIGIPKMSIMWTYLHLKCSTL
jgi:hypothetical protein